MLTIASGGEVVIPGNDVLDAGAKEVEHEFLAVILPRPFRGLGRTRTFEFHSAFYRAIRSGRPDIIRFVIDEVPGAGGSLDRCNRRNRASMVEGTGGWGLRAGDLLTARRGGTPFRGGDFGARHARTRGEMAKRVSIALASWAARSVSQDTLRGQLLAPIADLLGKSVLLNSMCCNTA